MTTAHDTNLDDALEAMTGHPLTRGEQLDALAVVSEDQPELAALLDHLCIQQDRVLTLADAMSEGMLNFGESMESMMGGGIGGMLGMLMGGGADDVLDVEED